MAVRQQVLSVLHRLLALLRTELGISMGLAVAVGLIVAYPDQSVHDVLAQFGGRDVGRIPVVGRDDQTKLLGVLRRHDIVAAYTREMMPGKTPKRGGEHLRW